MSQDPPTTDFMTLPEEELGEFRVASSVEIGAILRELQERQILLTVVSEDTQPLITRICELDLARGALGLELPVGAEDYSCKGLEVTAEAFLDHIRVQFELAPPVKVGSGSDAMLRTSLPALAYRFQRRRAFRVKPHSRAPQAEVLPIPLVGDTSRHKLRLLDISMGGTALLLPPEQAPWDAGQLLEAEIELDRHTRFKATLRVQHAMPEDPTLGTQFGCAFTSLQPDAQRQLQVYIDQTQKLSRLLKKT